MEIIISGVALIILFIIIVVSVRKLLPTINVEEIYMSEEMITLHKRIERQEDLIYALLDHLKLEVHYQNELALKKRK